MRSLMLTALVCVAAVACAHDAKSTESTESTGKTDSVEKPKGDDGAEKPKSDDSAAHDAVAVPAVDPCVTPSAVIGTPTQITLEDAAGVARSYLLYVPKTLDTKKPAPLVLNYHGLGSATFEQIAFSELDKIADAQGFITAYPEGLGKSFNAGPCCGDQTTPKNTTDDGAFARVLVADIEKRVCVNTRRVYSTGMSNGGYMSEYNACVNADLFAAVAPVSGMGLKQAKCEPARPVPMIAFNGSADTVVSYEGASKSVKDWLERDGCKGEPTRTMFGKSYCDAWTECSAGVEVVHCTATGMGHCWPGQGFCPGGGANVEINASAELWKFVSRFELPE